MLLALSYLGGEAAQIDLGLPGAVTGIFQGILLFYLLGCDILIHYRLRFGRRAHRGEGRQSMSFTWIVPVVLSVISAATPLLLAATGELVTEKSGVLNLGIEGMMLVGAVDRLCRDHDHRQCRSWASLPPRLPALALAFAFAVLTQILLANQVATGLALAILGTGLSALVGKCYVGVALNPLPKLDLPVLSDASHRRADPVPPGFPGLCLLRAGRRRLLVSLSHPRRPGPAGHRRFP